MLAVEATEPFDSDDHLFEIKWDGIRCLAFIEASRVRLQSRKRIDITAQFPELQCLRQLPQGTVLDGELVSMRSGIPLLALVQKRVQLRHQHRIDLLSQIAPVAYVVFDLLYAEVDCIMSKALWERRIQLERMVHGFKVGSVVLSDAVITQGRDLFAAAERLGQEGIMAKALNGTYAAGRRTALWKKVKVRRQ